MDEIEEERMSMQLRRIVLEDNEHWEDKAEEFRLRAEIVQDYPERNALLMAASDICRQLALMAYEAKMRRKYTMRPPQGLNPTVSPNPVVQLHNPKKLG